MTTSHISNEVQITGTTTVRGKLVSRTMTAAEWLVRHIGDQKPSIAIRRARNAGSARFTAVDGYVWTLSRV